MAKTKRKPASSLEQNHFGKDLNFAASEAYKLLRTNLMFFTPEGHGRVIGITSSVVGEGKSTTSINLAYALAESGKKVVLIECDMRRPTIARRLRFEASPGLSNLIIGRAAPAEVLRISTIHENLSVIPAGDIPPNPSELLGSDRMRLAIESLAADYEFVLIDLPPVTAVSDALVAANLIDGLLVVVRQGICTRHALHETMRQLQVVSDKILGFVYTCAGAENKGYYRKKYYKRGYGYGYGYGYGERPKHSSEAPENEASE